MPLTSPDRSRPVSAAAARPSAQNSCNSLARCHRHRLREVADATNRERFRVGRHAQRKRAAVARVDADRRAGDEDRRRRNRPVLSRVLHSTRDARLLLRQGAGGGKRRDQRSAQHPRSDPRTATAPPQTSVSAHEPLGCRCEYHTAGLDVACPRHHVRAAERTLLRRRNGQLVDGNESRPRGYKSLPRGTAITPRGGAVKKVSRTATPNRDIRLALTAGNASALPPGRDPVRPLLPDPGGVMHAPRYGQRTRRPDGGDDAGNDNHTTGRHDAAPPEASWPRTIERRPGFGSVPAATRGLSRSSSAERSWSGR